MIKLIVALLKKIAVTLTGKKVIIANVYNSAPLLDILNTGYMRIRAADAIALVGKGYPTHRKSYKLTVLTLLNE